MSAANQASPEGDSLRVYTLNEKGRLSGPIWTREIPDGLDPPNIMVLEQLKIAIDHTFPLSSPAPAPSAIK